MRTVKMLKLPEELEGQGDDENPDMVSVPAKWVICGTCRGNGQHSLHLGAITQEDRERDWDADSFADYLAGAYDRQCEPCGGSGKVLEITVDENTPRLTDTQRAALRALREEQEAAAEDEAERRAEARMLGEY